LSRVYFLFLIQLIFVIHITNSNLQINPKINPALQWCDMTLIVMNKLSNNSPTYSSRALGYIGLTMYETIVNGNKKYQSIAPQLNGLGMLPKPAIGKNVNWHIALNAGQAYIINKMFDFGDLNDLSKVDSLEKVIYKNYKSIKNEAENNYSVEYGKMIASKIYEWSLNDGGDQGFLKNFDVRYPFPGGKGKWIAPKRGQSNSKFPLHPYWGSNRSFVIANNLAVPKLITYSLELDSSYYKMNCKVYLKSFTLTEEEKEIAAWWSDDPTETFSPPGHSYSLAKIAVNTAKADIFKASQTFACVGMAVADAFINCWKAKYTYHCERPSSYIKLIIDENWVNFWPEPPFPSFYSGHSVQGAAAATVLQAIYGKNFAFIDVSHKGRLEDADLVKNIKFKPRKFSSFWQAAEESGYSRILGGIHTEYDNKIGLEEGKKIGKNINNLKWFN
jgi:PAP2 superfamily